MIFKFLVRLVERNKTWWMLCALVFVFVGENTHRHYFHYLVLIVGIPFVIITIVKRYNENFGRKNKNQ